jgi:Uma2 family endonuclease
MTLTMSEPAHGAHYSFDEYVAFERTSNVKHEYLDGQIYAVAGGTPEHAALAAAVTGLLYGQLRDNQVYSSDLRVRAGELTTYPDVTVVCGPPLRDRRDSTTTLNPTLVVEITSPSTQDYDRGEKLRYYQQIESLRAVLLVAHDRSALELWERSDAGWRQTLAGAGQSLELPAIGCMLAVDDVYAALS